MRLLASAILESFQNVGIVMQYLLMPVRHVDTKEFIHTISRSPIPAKNKHHASTIIVPLYVGTYLSMYLPQPHFKNQLKTITIVPV